MWQICVYIYRKLLNWFPQWLYQGHGISRWKRKVWNQHIWERHIPHSLFATPMLISILYPALNTGSSPPPPPTYCVILTSLSAGSWLGLPMGGTGRQLREKREKSRCFFPTPPKTDTLTRWLLAHGSSTLHDSIRLLPSPFVPSDVRKRCCPFRSTLDEDIKDISLCFP